MANSTNSLDSNFTRKIMQSFLDPFQSSRVLTKQVDTQLFAGKFNPSTGENIDVKRPTDYVSVRTAKGDVSGEDPSDIITGKATATVQDYFTTFVDYDEADEAIKMDQLDQLLAPMATRMATDFETDYAKFMMRNTALLAGTVGTAISTWDHVANAGAVLDTSGVPKDGMWTAVVNPFTQIGLASDTRGLGAGGVAGGVILSAHQKAMIQSNFAGMDVFAANTLGTYTSDAEADRTGTLSGTPDATYLTAKDTMTQSLDIAGIGAGTAVVKAGETVIVTAAGAAVNRLNLSTREPIIDASGNQVLWSGTVVADVAMVGGAGTIVVTGPAIFEAGGQYNTVSAPIVSGDAITIQGAAGTLKQPGLFFHKQAFTVASVPIKKLQSVDTVATTEDGLQFRVSKGSDFLANRQQVRIDFRPAYGVMNPFFAGQLFGS